MDNKSELRKLKRDTWVRVHWDDIVSDDDAGWVETQDAKLDVAHCITAGLVIKKNKRQVTLAMTGSGAPVDNQVGTLTAIPLGCITKVEVWPNG